MPARAHPCPGCGTLTRGMRCRRCADGTPEGREARRAERACRDCGGTFTGVGQQKACAACSQVRKQARAREQYRTNPAIRERNRQRARDRHRRLRDQIVPKLREHARAPPTAQAHRAGAVRRLLRLLRRDRLPIPDLRSQRWRWRGAPPTTTRQHEARWRSLPHRPRAPRVAARAGIKNALRQLPPSD